MRRVLRQSILKESLPSKVSFRQSGWFIISPSWALHLAQESKAPGNLNKPGLLPLLKTFETILRTYYLRRMSWAKFVVRSSALVFNGIASAASETWPPSLLASSYVDTVIISELFILQSDFQ